MMHVNPRLLFVACFIAAAPARAQNAVPEPSAEQYLRGLASPGAGAKLALGLLFDQATDAIPEWGSGGDGLRRRADWLAAGYAARYSAEFAVAKALSRDTAYRRCRCRGFPRRAAHALREEFTERRADGSASFAAARMTGILTSSAVAAPMLPESYGAAAAASRTATSIGIDEGLNMLQEFWPEIRRTLLFRKNAGSLQNR
jgi:hypothetical protein